MDIQTKFKKQSPGENIHREYWRRVFRDFLNFICKHKKPSFSIILVVILIILAYFGYIKYSPEINTFIGKFELGDASTTMEKVNPDSGSTKLDRSVFDLIKDISTRELTSQQRVNSITNISGLETKEEVGIVEDIGINGLTLIIRGNSSDGFVGLVKCDFSPNWKQRITLLKKDSEIKFIGIVSEYNLFSQLVFLKDCRLSE